MKTCLECKTQYQSTFNSPTCKIASCQGVVVDLDNDMLDPIYILNEKGYRTYGCSAGNTWGQDIYITFMQEISQLNIEPIPIGFSTEFLEDFQMICLKYSVQLMSVSKVQILEELMRARIELLKWTEKLPNIEVWKISFKDLDKTEIDTLDCKYNDLLKSDLPVTIQFIDYDNFEVGFSLAGKVDDIASIAKDIIAYAKSKGLRNEIYKRR